MDKQAFVEELRDIGQRAQEHNISFKAAGITYYTLVAWIPILILGFVVLTVFFGANVAQDLTVFVEDLFTPRGINVIEEVLTQTTGLGSVTTVSIILLVWSALKLFRGFDIAFSEIAHQEQKKQFLPHLKDASIGFVLISLAVTVTIGASLLGSTIIGSSIVDLIAAIIQFGSLTLVFVALYYTFLNLPVRHLILGSLLVAGGWTLLQVIFRLYLTYTVNPVYSVFGGVLGIVIWLYLGNLLIILGAILNTIQSEK